MNQSVWNYLTNRKWEYGIGDYDIFYWDNDLSESKENEIKQKVLKMFSNLKCKFDVVNQARVHKWFSDYFGIEMPGYKSLEHAVSSAPSTVTCIVVTGINGEYKIIAPNGLGDIFSMTLRYNSQTFIPDKFVIPKIEKWKSKWPELKEIRNSHTRA